MEEFFFHSDKNTEACAAVKQITARDVSSYLNAIPEILRNARAMELN